MVDKKHGTSKYDELPPYIGMIITQDAELQIFIYNNKKLLIIKNKNREKSYFLKNYFLN